MRPALLALALLTLMWAGVPARGQRPSIPPQAIDGPDLGYRAVDPAEAFDLPDGVAFASVAAVTIDREGHVFVLHRGEQSLMEFDADGRFIRAFGEGLFARSHGLRVNDDGTFWVTDVSGHVVMKLGEAGEVLMTLGTRGESGEWDEAAGSRLFSEPNDVALGPDGSIFVAQGHGRGEPRVLKFDSDGNFLMSWGGRGTLPGQFEVAHSIVIDDEGLVYVADRENRRIQVFDTDGNFLKGWLYKGMACALHLTEDGYIYMSTGFDGQIVKLDMNGVVLGVTGQPGEGPNEYGEAHFLTVSGRDEIYVADVVNRRVEKLVPR